MGVISYGIDRLSYIPAIDLIPKIGVKDIFEIILLAAILYYCIKHLKGTRVWLLFKGAMIGLGVYCLAYILDLDVIVSLFQSLLVFVGVAVIVAIQPEIRKFVETIGTKSLNNSILGLVKNITKLKDKEDKDKQLKISDNSIQELAKACFSMGKVKTGALICIEGDIPLKEYIESGIDIDAILSDALLINIFEKNTPLHDGAVIMRSNRVVAATCYLPLSENKRINKNLGTRHRAAIGLTEATDALVIVVSEETGNVSIAIGGKIYTKLNREDFVEHLNNYRNKFKPKEVIEKVNLHNGLSLKLVSLVISLLIWIIVINNINPVISTTFRDIPIQIVNESAIETAGKTYEVISDSLVDVTVTDTKDIIDSLKFSDISVIADMSKMSFVNAVNLEVSIAGNSSTHTELSEHTLQIAVEDIITTEVGINTKVNEVSKDYYISDIMLDNDTLIISGAKSIVNTIGSVVVELNTEELDKSNIVKLEPLVYDKNGQVIDKSKLKLSSEYILANVSLYNTKKVPLNIIPNVVDPAIESIISDIHYENQEIYIAGPDELLDDCDAVNITADIDIDIQDIASNQFIKNISIQAYLPEGLVVVGEYSNESLIVDFVDFYIRAFQLKSSDIKIMGRSDDIEATIKPFERELIMISNNEDINDVTVSDIRPYIDISNLDIGNHETEIGFMTDKVKITGNFNIEVTISEKIIEEDNH